MTIISGGVYSLALAALERALPIKPTWVAAEVVGGVLLVGIPVMLAARSTSTEAIAWRDYERLVIVGFIGAALPISLWQLLEYLR
jgi:protein-S-isoprenylcysteine O-methyltransferase Ste14